jgi:mycothiol system anti-sigma-R factor
MEEEVLTPFRHHVGACGPCAERLDHTRRVLVLVRQRCARHSAPPRLRQRILLSLQRGELGRELQ